MARRMSLAAGGLLATIVLVLFHQSCSAEDGHHCAPSSCGNIHNISYPFRLTGDPADCGHQNYSLSCENNQTVLYLFDGRFYVREINYSSYTIRVVDSGIQEGNLSFIPRYFLNRANFSLRDPYSTSHPFNVYGQCKAEWIWAPTDLRGPWPESVVFLNCEKPLKSGSFFNISTCSKNSSLSQSKRYGYVKFGSPMTTDVEELCQIEQMTLTLLEEQHSRTLTGCTNVYKELAHGFELSWFLATCDNVTEYGDCHIANYPVDCPVRSRPGYIDRLRESVTGFCLITKGILGSPCAIGLLIYPWRRRHLSMYDGVEEFLQSQNSLILIRYSYSDIRKMTTNFKDKLGEGGYGTVFKGKLRSGGLVAVKMLGKSKANGQDFISEVATIGRIYHVNVVQLIGFCVEGSKRALIYEFMPNGSLNKHIFPQEGSILLSYKRMYDIALGVARGIEYLHQGCDMQILHFDIKLHNILLDENFTPKIFDFGLAKLYPAEDSIVSLTAARGTLGYMAPELFYKNIGGIFYKADVYSFGMLLMEMAGRRKINDFAEHSSQIYFPTWVYDQFLEGKDVELEDATEEEKKTSKKMIMVALWCIQMKPNDRPSMTKVIEMLEGEIECLQMPSNPFLSSTESLTKVVGDNSNSTSSSSLLGESWQSSQS
ncbi:hypothetical protein I3843_12G058600 [Carya illinoinensis]|nr:hypothetical protein I3843_12G058600 [Carya illinoinensis]